MRISVSRIHGNVLPRSPRFTTQVVIAPALSFGLLLSLFLAIVIAFVVHLAGGLVIMPMPWASIPSVIPGLTFVVPIDEDPGDPGDGGDGDGHGEDNHDDRTATDVDVHVWREEDGKVRLLVTLAGDARGRFKERGAEWLRVVIRNAVRRSFADHPLHRPFRRTTHLEPRPPRDPSETDFES